MKDEKERVKRRADEEYLGPHYLEGTLPVHQAPPVTHKSRVSYVPSFRHESGFPTYLLK